jgi:hypothetical protein
VTSTLPPPDLARHVAGLRAAASFEPATAEDLAQHLGDLYRAVYDTDLGAFDAANVKASAGAIVTALFDLRAEIRDRIPGWHARGLVSRDVQKALRDCFRALRYASDIVGELGIGFERLTPDSPPMQAFTGTHFNTLVHRDVDTGEPLPFRSGDVMMVRGVRHNSAAIARIGDVDSQFSHLALVYVDDGGGHWLIEALIEDGAVVTPLEEALNHGLGRAMLFRARDPELAQRAAKLMHDHVQETLQPGRQRILYDFSMLLKSYRRLFCSKLVRQAYDTASAGSVLLPTYRTQFVENRDFYRRIGVKAKETFAPGDMEIEPNFDLVAEWQDYRVTPRLRLQDMVMTKMFEWMERGNWRFKDDLPIFLVGLLGRFAASLSDRAKALLADVIPKVPINMRRRTIATIAMLQKTAEPLLEALEARERESIELTGHPQHPRDVLTWLETARKNSGGRLGYLTGPV